VYLKTYQHFGELVPKYIYVFLNNNLFLMIVILEACCSRKKNNKKEHCVLKYLCNIHVYCLKWKCFLNAECMSLSRVHVSKARGCVCGVLTWEERQQGESEEQHRQFLHRAQNPLCLKLNDISRTEPAYLRKPSPSGSMLVWAWTNSTCHVILNGSDSEFVVMTSKIFSSEFLRTHPEAGNCPTVR
jgi:hypothetical protein